MCVHVHVCAFRNYYESCIYVIIYFVRRENKKIKH
jgi:hypothetical protein